AGSRAPSVSSDSNGSPVETRSPTAILSSATRPTAGDGTSIVALSVSSVTRGSSGLTSSPGFTRTSTISTSEKSPRSGTTTSTVGTPGSDRNRVRLLGIDAELLDGLPNGLHVEAALLGERVQRGDDDPTPVHLEEIPQCGAAVAAAEAVGAEHGVGARHPLADLVRDGLHVVGRRDERTLNAVEARRDVALPRLLAGVQLVPPVD